jgi:hypothetical protein
LQPLSFEDRLGQVCNSLLFLFLAVVPYEVTVTTGDVSGAGTDARIFITVFGTKGTTSPLELENTNDRFQRARTDLIRVSV